VFPEEGPHHRTAGEEGGERSYLFFDGVFSHAVVRPRTMEAEGGTLPDGVPGAPGRFADALVRYLSR
jgi:hypothetical protein